MINRRSFLKGAAVVPAAAAAPVKGVDNVVREWLFVYNDAPALVEPTAPVEKYPWKFYTSKTGGEYCENECDTLEEALEIAKQEAEDYGQTVEVWKARGQDFYLRPDAERMLEDLAENYNEERIGEDGEFLEYTPEQLADLEDMLERTIFAWADKHKISTKAWYFDWPSHEIETVQPSPETKAAMERYETERKERERAWLAAWDEKSRLHAQKLHVAEHADGVVVDRDPGLQSHLAGGPMVDDAELEGAVPPLEAERGAGLVLPAVGHAAGGVHDLPAVLVSPGDGVEVEVAAVGGADVPEGHVPTARGDAVAVDHDPGAVSPELAQPPVVLGDVSAAVVGYDKIAGESGGGHECSHAGGD